MKVASLILTIAMAFGFAPESGLIEATSDQAKPDLIVTKCSFSPASPTTADRIMISVEMKNQGTFRAVIPAGASVWSASHPRGGSVGGASSGQPIAPGQVFSGGVYFIEPGEVNPGTYQVKVKVDPDNRCQEGNEANNEYTSAL